MVKLINLRQLDVIELHLSSQQLFFLMLQNGHYKKMLSSTSLLVSAPRTRVSDSFHGEVIVLESQLIHLHL